MTGVGWALWLCACQSGGAVLPDRETGSAPDNTGATDTADSGTDSGEPVKDPYASKETVGDQPAAESDWMFDPTFIHTVAIEIDDTSWYNLLNLPYDYTPATVRIDGVEAPDVGMRLRGKIGSFRPITGKPKFKIDVNQYQSDRRFFGLKSFSLNNAVVDCSYEKEILGYEVLRQLGLPSPRITFANVTVNSVDYGLYLLLDSEDKVFVGKNYTDDSGNLYDGKYDYDYLAGTYSLIDFIAGMDDLFQLEEGTDVGLADIHAITELAAANYGGPDYEGGLDPVLDWDRFHRTWAAEQWLGHNDGYALNQNNYRIYFDPSDGQADIISWDLDYAFLEDSWWGMSWWAPRGTLAAGCWADAECIQSQRDAAIAVTGEIDVPALVSQLAAWDALTTERAYADPRRECTVENVASYRTFVHDWLGARPAYMQSFWGF